MGTSLDCASRILVEGTLPPEAGQLFESYLHVQFDTPPAAMRVCFNSRGGYLAGGMSLGRAIRRHGFDTCIDRNYVSVHQPELQPTPSVVAENAQCASACVLAFMGGFDRIVSDDALVGVHQFAGSYGPLGDSLTQVTQTELAQYLDEMRVSRRLLDVASLVPPASIRWLTRVEAHGLMLDTTGGSMTPWTLQTDTNGLLSAQLVIIHPDLRGGTQLSVFSRGSEAALDVSFGPGDGNQAAALQLLQSAGLVTLSIDDAIVAEWPSSGWTRAFDPFITIRLPLGSSIRESLATGKELELTVGPSHCCGRYDPSVAVPLSGLAQLLPAVMPQTHADEATPTPTDEKSSERIVLAIDSVSSAAEPKRSAGITALTLNAVPILIGVAVLVVGLALLGVNRRRAR